MREGGYILRFATQGEIILRLIESELKQGIEVIAVDEGPGIQDVSLAMQEGYLLADDHQIVRQGLKTPSKAKGSRSSRRSRTAGKRSVRRGSRTRPCSIFRCRS